jgi:subtilisin family serine protease
MPAVKRHLSNRYTAGFLRGGANTVTWLSTDPNNAADALFREHGVTQRAWPQITGANQIVSVADTGLSTGSYFFYDPTRGPGPGHRKVIKYTSFADSVDQVEGHGTHVCGTIAGSLDCNQKGPDGKSICQYRFSRFEGMAPGALIHLQDIGHVPPDTTSVTLSNIDPGEMVDDLRTTGAQISSNSWGSDISPEQTYQYTKVAYDNPDILFVFAVGNDGVTINSPGDSKNILPVGASSNPHASGLSALLTPDFIEELGGSAVYPVDICQHGTNDCATGYDAIAAGNGSVWKSDWTDSVSYYWNYPTSTTPSPGHILVSSTVVPEGQANVGGIIMVDTSQSPLSQSTIPIIRIGQEAYNKIKDWSNVDLYPAVPKPAPSFSIASFSGRGPTILGLDGPLVVAPGDFQIFSAMGQAGSLNDHPTSFTAALAHKAGTSMATPAISGLVALYREYINLTFPGVDNVTSYLMRAIVVATARPLGTIPRVDSGYGFPRLTRLEYLGFFDACQIESGQHLRFTFTVPPASANDEIHVVLSYLDPPLMQPIYPLFADLDLTVLTPSGLKAYGNELNSYDSFTTNEKVVLSAHESGSYSIHITASVFPIATQKINFALAVNAETFRPTIAFDTSLTTCLEVEVNNAICKNGWLECVESRAGPICNIQRDAWAQNPGQQWNLRWKEIAYGHLTRELPENQSYTGIQFTATHNATRGVVVCISTQRFKQLAEPNVLCTTDVYGQNGTIYKPLWIEVTQKEKHLKLWTAAYCVSNSTCSFSLTWKNADPSIGVLPVGAIVGIVIGGVVFIGAIAGICFCCCRKRNAAVANEV